MASSSRLRGLLGKQFGEWFLGKTLTVLSVCALFGVTVANEPVRAQGTTSHPPVINTTTQWTLNAPALVSTTSSGVTANSFGLHANYSPDSTHLLFWSAANNLAPGTAGGVEQLYIKDLTTGAVALVSSNANGAPGSDMSFSPNNASQVRMFSPDGTKVVFESAAKNLLASGPTNGFIQIFVKDLTSGAVTLVSADMNGLQGNNDCANYTFSPDGTKVAFGTAATSLLAGTTHPNDILIKDLNTGLVTLVSATGNGMEGNGSSSMPVFSPDGTEVAFVSNSTNLTSDMTNGSSEIFVKNLVTGAVTLVSATAAGAAGNGASKYPMFSPDGGKAAFSSIATNLGSVSGNSEVYVKDLATGAITLVSTDANGNAANSADSQLPVFSADGTKLAFESSAINLLSIATSGQQVFVKDLLSGAVTLASTDASGNQGTSQSSDPNFSPDHKALAFQSMATNIGPTGGTFEIFARPIFTASGAVVDNPFTATLTTGGQLSFSDVDTNDTHAATVATQSSNLGTLMASVSKDSTGTGTGGVISWNYQVAESQVQALTAVATDTFTLTLTSSEGCTATTTIVVTDLPRNFSVVNAGSGSPSSTSKSSCPTVAATTTALASSQNPSVFGQTVTFNVTVSSTAGTPTGTVTFLDGGTNIGTATLDSTGKASFTTSSLAVGTHAITASYGGDTAFKASGSSTLSQIVNQDAATVALNSSTNPSVFGQAVTFTIAVGAAAPGAGTPTGTVTFVDGGTTIGTGTLDSSGQASLTSSSLAVGTHSITASYGGGANFSASSSTPVSQVVNQDATTVMLNSSPNPSVFGQAVTFTIVAAAAAPGAGLPTGTVTLQDGTTSLGAVNLANGQASLTTSTLAVGSHSFTAVYNGDSNFGGGSSAVLSQVVNKDSSSVTLSSSVNPSVFGQATTFTVSVAAAAPGAGTATGTITFLDGATSVGTGTLDSSGSASLVVSSLAVGTHSITALYGGDGNFNASSSAPLSQVVNKDGATVTLSSSVNPSVFGQAVSFTVVVTTAAPGAGAPTGTVTFQDGTIPLGPANLANGQASFQTSALAVGFHAITASYSGDGNFNPGSSAALSQTVNKDGSSVLLSSSVNPSVFGQAVVMTATVSAAAPGAGTPTGTITFTEGTTNLGNGNLLNGQASITLPALGVGPHSITATYGGDGNFNSSMSVLTQTVNKASTTTTLSSSAGPSTLNQAVTFSATVSVVAPGAGTPSGTVTFSDGATTLGTAPLSSTGTATFSTSALGAQSHPITAVYSGDGNFSGSSGSLTQNVQYSICVLYDQTRSVHHGATFPIKIYLCDAAGNDVSAPSIIVHATAVTNVSGQTGVPEAPGNANPDNDFRYDSGLGPAGGYIFNLSTQGLPKGTNSLQFMAGADPVPHAVGFGVK